MRTEIDVLVDTVRQARAEAIALSGRDHTPQQVSKFLTDVGSDLEVFLKKTIYQGTKDRVKFYFLINELAQLGVSPSAVTALDLLRDKYNDVKHNPRYSAPVGEVIAILADVERSLIEMRTLNLGSSAQVVVVSYRRVMWWAAWDHYIGGDTEFHLILPTADEANYAPTIDTIYIAMERWDDVKSELTAAGGFKLGQDAIPRKLYEEWAREGDFLAAGSFAGDYRQFISILAKHERVEDLIPSLKRENDFRAMFAAVMMAAVDVIKNEQTIIDGNLEMLEERIVCTAAATYAAPRHSVLIVSLTPRISAILSNLPADVQKAISGPYWVSESEFRKHQSTAVVEMTNPEVLVTKDGRVLVRL